MATAVKTGVILRRGASNMPAKDLKALLDNDGEAERIITEIDARRDVYLEAERAAVAAQKKVEASEEALAKHEADLDEGLAALEADRADADRKHQADMDALGRRSREVIEKEKVIADELAAAAVKIAEADQAMARVKAISADLAASIEAHDG